MDLEDYAVLLKDAINRTETIVFSCRCQVRYSGRAESYLDTGDRVVMIKSDGALLIHQPTGNAPINYMKPGTSHTLIINSGKLKLKSNNIHQKESIDVSIDKMHFFNSHKLEDAQNIIVSGTEDDMSDMIYRNPAMIEDGFKPVSQEEQTKYGFIDVMGVDKKGVLTIVECKRYCAELSAVTQLRRYVEKIMVSKGITKVRGIIAAPKITENAKKMLEDWGFEFKSINPPKYFEEYDKKQARLDVF
ncbi:endonuclease NucS [Candidatus Woesearchaeota archaeon]|nr:endonuclease NucS [Candidatus Woesearchaeota archaeon]